MDIIKDRQADRLKKIGVVKNSIERAKNPDYEKLILTCCSEWGVTRRTAKEYIEIAKFELGI